jgi:hypothetical protein
MNEARGRDKAQSNEREMRMHPRVSTSACALCTPDSRV